MITTHKIFGEFYEQTFTLIALHSSLEDFAMAYAINKSLKINLHRSKEDLDMSGDISFPFFEWKDELTQSFWQLIANTSGKEENLSTGVLFLNEASYTIKHLIPEYKDVDYFLKIEHDDSYEDAILLKSVLSISEVVTAYTLDANKLKSKQNLIF